jgi:hypothetical protein
MGMGMRMKVKVKVKVKGMLDKDVALEQKDD